MVWSTAALIIALLVLHRSSILSELTKIPLPKLPTPTPAPAAPAAPAAAAPAPQAGAGISPMLSQLINQHLSAVYAVKANRGEGSGFLIKGVNGEAIVSTNRHVVGDSKTVQLVNFATNASCPDQPVIYTSPQYDVAFVRLTNCAKANPITTRTPDTVNVGDQIFTVGNALGQGLSISGGKVTEKNRIIATREATTPDGIAHNALTHKGNSGGPLFSADGTVIGMNTAKGDVALAIGMKIILEESRNIK